jgi:hypothetical protein
MDRPLNQLTKMPHDKRSRIDHDTGSADAPPRRPAVGPVERRVRIVKVGDVDVVRLQRMRPMGQK